MTLISVAAITGAHGIKGEVKVKSFTTNPIDFSKFGALHTKAGSTIEITRAKLAKDHFICSIKNIVDRNQAEALRGIELFIERAKLGAEPLLIDMVGKELINAGQSLGPVVGFQNFGAGDLAELESGLLVPVRFITIAEILTADLPAGFLDPE